MAANFVEEIGMVLRLKSFLALGKGKIILANGQSAPVSPALEELQIKTMTGTELNTHQVLGLFAYARKCQRLKKLSFIDCVLPLVFPVNSLSKRLLEIEVSWNPPKHGFRLDSTTGKWILNTNEATILETNGQHSLRLLCSSVVLLEGTDSTQLQMARILLLEIASSLNIPISYVDLSLCSPGVHWSGLNLILESGLSLSILSYLQKLQIWDYMRILTNEELAAILLYSSKCTSLKELMFGVYNLPDTIPVGSIPSSLKSRNVKVWSVSASSRRLDLQTGGWQVCDDDGNLSGEEGFDEESYQENLAMFN